MPELSLTVFTFKEKISAICQQLFDFGLSEYEKRKAEVDMFWECVNEAKQENKEMGMKAIEDFMAEKKSVSYFLPVSRNNIVVLSFCGTSCFLSFPKNNKISEPCRPVENAAVRGKCGGAGT